MGLLQPSHFSGGQFLSLVSLSTTVTSGVCGWWWERGVLSPGPSGEMKLRMAEGCPWAESASRRESGMLDTQVWSCSPAEMQLLWGFIASAMLEAPPAQRATQCSSAIQDFCLLFEQLTLSPFCFSGKSTSSRPLNSHLTSHPFLWGILHFHLVGLNDLRGIFQP